MYTKITKETQPSRDKTRSKQNHPDLMNFYSEMWKSRGRCLRWWSDTNCYFICRSSRAVIRIWQIDYIISIYTVRVFVAIFTTNPRGFLPVSDFERNNPEFVNRTKSVDFQCSSKCSTDVAGQKRPSTTSKVKSAIFYLTCRFCIEKRIGQLLGFEDNAEPATHGKFLRFNYLLLSSFPLTSYSLKC